MKESKAMQLSDILASIAVIVSIATASVQLIGWLRDRSNLHVAAEWSFWHDASGKSQRSPFISIVNRSITGITIENITVGANTIGSKSKGFEWAASNQTLRYELAGRTVSLPVLLQPGEMIRLSFPKLPEFTSMDGSWKFGVAVTHSLSDKLLRRKLPF